MSWLEQTAASGRERAVTFDCHGETLVGIHHQVANSHKPGVLIVVGGRQYRVGAHRQFVQLARYLAEQGIPVFRFDVRGMGDSTGSERKFLELQDDIRSALQAFQLHSGTRSGFVIWGLCDGATAGLLHAVKDPRIAGVMLVNPWISTDKGVARTIVKHYYRDQLLSRQFWSRLFSGKVALRESLSSFWSLLRQASPGQEKASMVNASEPPVESLPERMFSSLQAFDGLVKIIISSRDLTAREFEDEFQQQVKSGALIPSVNLQLRGVESDHTFSNQADHELLCRITADWIAEFDENRRVEGYGCSDS